MLNPYLMYSIMTSRTAWLQDNPLVCMQFTEISWAFGLCAYDILLEEFSIVVLVANWDREWYFSPKTYSVNYVTLMSLSSDLLLDPWSQLLSSVEESFKKTKTTKQGKIHQQKGVRPTAVSWFELNGYSTLPGAPLPKTSFEEQSLKRVLFFNLLNSDECTFEVTTRRNFRKVCNLVGQHEPKQSTGFFVVW